MFECASVPAAEQSHAEEEHEVERARWLPWGLGVALGLAVGTTALLVVLLWRGPSPVSVSVREAGRAEPEEPTEQPLSLSETIAEERGNAIVRAVDTIRPAMVAITTRRPANLNTPRDLFAFLERGVSERSGLGSGFLVDPRGYVLTANHVVEGSTELHISLSDGQTFQAELVGKSPEFDLAVVKIKGEVSGLPVARLGDSDQLRNGEWAIALGSPFANFLDDPGPTVTVGVISALHADVDAQAGTTTYFDMIQTDATILPGNSGGPLVNARGEVVGVNTLGITRAGTATGMGLAIPINRARWVMQELLTYGRVRGRTVGVTGVPLDAGMRRHLGLGDEWPDGWLVQGVEEGSPAAERGLQEGDVIVSVDGEPLVSRRGFRTLREAHVGTTVELGVWRQGEIFQVQVTFVEVSRP